MRTRRRVIIGNQRCTGVRRAATVVAETIRITGIVIDAVIETGPSITGLTCMAADLLGQVTVVLGAVALVAVMIRIASPVGTARHEARAFHAVVTLTALDAVTRIDGATLIEAVLVGLGAIRILGTTDEARALVALLTHRAIDPVASIRGAAPVVAVAVGIAGRVVSALLKAGALIAEKLRAAVDGLAGIVRAAAAVAVTCRIAARGVALGKAGTPEANPLRAALDPLAIVGFTDIAVTDLCHTTAVVADAVRITSDLFRTTRKARAPVTQLARRANHAQARVLEGSAAAVVTNAIGIALDVFKALGEAGTTVTGEVRTARHTLTGFVFALPGVAGFTGEALPILAAPGRAAPVVRGTADTAWTGPGPCIVEVSTITHAAEDHRFTPGCIVSYPWFLSGPRTEVGDLGPTHAVPLPGVVKKFRPGPASEEQDPIASAIVSHAMSPASRGAGNVE